jgi:hypothetical protein
MGGAGRRRDAARQVPGSTLPSSVQRGATAPCADCEGDARALGRERRQPELDDVLDASLLHRREALEDVANADGRRQAGGQEGGEVKADDGDHVGRGRVHEAPLALQQCVVEARARLQGFQRHLGLLDLAAQLLGRVGAAARVLNHGQQRHLCGRRPRRCCFRCRRRGCCDRVAPPCARVAAAWQWRDAALSASPGCGRGCWGVAGRALSRCAPAERSQRRAHGVCALPPCGAGAQEVAKETLSTTEQAGAAPQRAPLQLHAREATAHVPPPIAHLPRVPPTFSAWHHTGGSVPAEGEGLAET